MYVDFHIHSNYSDGSKSIKEILEICNENNVSIISITDHNGINTNKINSTIKIINGMEIDVEYNKTITLHFLLYDFDINSKKIKEYLDKNRKHEIINFKKRISEFEKKYNHVLNKKLVNKFISTNNYFDTVRLNNLLVYLNICDNPSEAYYKYTNSIKSYNRYSITLDELFEISKDSKGIVSLAHPLNYKIDIDEIKSIILNLVNKYDLKVVEAINSHQNLEEQKSLINFCIDNNLLISGGSDSHYQHGSKSSKKIGYVNGLKIKDTDLSFLKLIGGENE